ncbi:MAG: protein-L-isoaspartate O-methyltransferase [Alphaproteobacteria bacterium]|nr:protein-L-isoaspartate O-methyltransferase [Alphaproteobacteria bacterium]
MSDFAAQRLNMVESQLRTNKVTDARLLKAMFEIPRERFLPERLRGIAYVDEDIALGNGRYVIEPMVAARLIQAAQIAPDDVTLEIGTGTGYVTAVLSRLATTVLSVECDAALARGATDALGGLGFDNAVVVAGALRDGHPKQAPYDVIVIAGAVDEIPEAVLGQLAEGGRLVAVVVGDDGVGRATLVQRRSGATYARPLFDANTPRLPGFERAAQFAF